MNANVGKPSVPSSKPGGAPGYFVSTAGDGRATVQAVKVGIEWDIQVAPEWRELTTFRGFGRLAA